LWAKAEYFSVEDDGLLKVSHRSKLTVTITEMNCELTQRGSSLGVAVGAKLQCFTIKVDRLVDVIGPPSLLELGDERFCS
jgi:hypothetical protein